MVVGEKGGENERRSACEEVAADICRIMCMWYVWVDHPVSPLVQ
jgi:hypothetical protein